MLLFNALFIEVVGYTFQCIQNKNTGLTVFTRIWYGLKRRVVAGFFSTDTPFSIVKVYSRSCYSGPFPERVRVKPILLVTKSDCRTKNTDHIILLDYSSFGIIAWIIIL